MATPQVQTEKKLRIPEVPKGGEKYLISSKWMDYRYPPAFGQKKEGERKFETILVEVAKVTKVNFANKTDHIVIFHGVQPIFYWSDAQDKFQITPAPS